MKRNIIALFSATVCLIAGAATNYVDCAFLDCSPEDYAQHDGSSWEKAFATIQEGVDNSSDYDTVLVAKGRYDVGGKMLEGDGTNRVMITQKYLHLKAASCAAETFIVGSRDLAGAVDAEGNGPAAVRCVYASGNYSVIEGFTLADGAAHPTSNGENLERADGGAFRGSTLATLVDCVVTNCVGVRGGAMRYGQAVRTLFVDNRATWKGAVGNRSRLLHCVAMLNGGSSSAIVGGSAVNCTFAVNDGSYVATENTIFCNSIAVCHTQVGDATDSGQLRATNCVFTAGTTSAGKGFFNSLENTLTNASPVQLMNPLFGDCRLLPTSDAIGRGDAELVASVLNLPDSVDPWIDFAGVPIAVRTGPINAGAIQTPASAPGGGVLRFTEASASVNGSREFTHIFNDGLYVVADEPYCQFHVKPIRPAANRYFFRFKRTGLGYGDGSNFFPMPDDTLWMMAPAAGLVYTNLLDYVANCRYVNPMTGSDSNTGLTEDKAVKTIQCAVDKAGSSQTVIYCAAGDYDSDDLVGFSGGVSNRLTLSSSSFLRIVGAGADKSVIWGWADSDDPAGDGFGRGPGAIRCVMNNSTKSALQGFTLANGHTGYVDGGTSTDSANSGGGLYNNSGALTLTDCVITNCVGYRGAIYGGKLYRCRITDSLGLNGGIRYATVYSSVIDYNKPGSGNGVMMSGNSVFYRCTAIGFPENDTITGSQPITNSIVYRTSSTSSSWKNWGGTYVFNPSVSLSCGIVMDPQLVSPGIASSSENDYRLLSTSPCVGGGVMHDAFVKNYSPDFYGNPLVIRDGKPTAGAVQTFVQGLAILGGNGVSFSDGETSYSSATNSLSPGETKTITYSETAVTRPVAAMKVNGVEETVYDGKSWSFTAPAAEESVTAAFTLEPVFSTNWYVNANADDNSGNGFRPETAKKSFHETDGIFETGRVKSGDCVHAASGAYDRGVKTDMKMSTRVVIPTGVTLVADEGPEKTFIVGQDAATNPDAKGRGTDGVRCVSMPSKTSLIGFTVTGGRVNYGDSDESGYGGGVYAASTDSSWLIGCIVSNNAATRGGGMHYGFALNCRFYDNWASANRAALSQSRARGCIFDRNFGDTIVQNVSLLDNCTFGPDNFKEDGVTEATALAYPSGPIRNCLIDGKVSGLTGNSGCGGFTNCIFVAGKMYAMEVGARVDICNCLTTTVENLVFDANHMPRIGSNVAIDAGSAGILASGTLAETDLFGNPRVSNRTLDIGAVEADWRPAYGAALGTGVAITNATAGVKLVDGRIELQDGDAVHGVWNSVVSDRRVNFGCSFAATDGTLAGAVGKHEVEVTDSETLAYREKTAAQAIDVSFAGMGSGTVFGFSQTLLGFMMYIK